MSWRNAQGLGNLLGFSERSVPRASQCPGRVSRGPRGTAARVVIGQRAMEEGTRWHQPQCLAWGRGTHPVGPLSPQCHQCDSGDGARTLRRSHPASPWGPPILSPFTATWSWLMLVPWGWSKGWLPSPDTSEQGPPKPLARPPEPSLPCSSSFPFRAWGPHKQQPVPTALGLQHGVLPLQSSWPCLPPAPAAHRAQPLLVPAAPPHTLICTIYSGFYRSQGVGGSDRHQGGAGGSRIPTLNYGLN